MSEKQAEKQTGIDRRIFMGTVGATAGYIALSSGMPPLAASTNSGKGRAKVLGAFVYPPTEILDEEGYYSWPGSSFDAEGRQASYMKEIRAIGERLDMDILMREAPLDTDEQTAAFIDEIKRQNPDGLLLIPFKKGHWERLVKVIQETKVPSIVMATLGVLLIGHVRQLRHEPGVYMISAQDDMNSIAYGMKMIHTARWMRESRIINIDNDEFKESKVPNLGTTIIEIPRARFVEECQKAAGSAEAKNLAKRYLAEAQEIVEPSEKDIYDAATTYFALKRLVEQENSDAVMMNCLPGLKHPHQHVPPCMGFMNLRDEGIPVGCESDTDATLTMMLIQKLFDVPAFQHNPTVDTSKNHYICAHCTSASKMNGPDSPSEPYILRSHAEAGWGCVPRVLFKAGQEVTITKYLQNETTPQMLVYTGTMIGCPPIPPTGGCRTNAETTINELEDVCDLKGHHLCMFYGNHGRQLRDFCQLTGIEAMI